MATPAYQRERRRLAEALRSLRVAAGLTGAQLAEQTGWQQSKVSKIETLKQLPDENDIRAWSAGTGGSEEDVDQMLATLRSARAEYAAWKDAYRVSGAGGVQEDILALEARSTRIAEFQPAFMSGLLQTADYAREILHLPCGPLTFGNDEADIQRAVTVRMQRQQALYDTSKRVRIVMLEGALMSRVVSVPVLTTQLIRLIDLAGLSTLELGIIPFSADIRVWPLSGFRLYDDLVIVESLVGEQQLAEPEDVSRYENYLELLEETASSGPDAVTIIRRALASIRDQK
jgi:transcriptional regulator with XRE-family HTH domain